MVWRLRDITDRQRIASLKLKQNVDIGPQEIALSLVCSLFYDSGHPIGWVNSPRAKFAHLCSPSLKRYWIVGIELDVGYKTLEGGVHFGRNSWCCICPRFRRFIVSVQIHPLISLQLLIAQDVDGDHESFAGAPRVAHGIPLNCFRFA